MLTVKASDRMPNTVYNVVHRILLNRQSQKNIWANNRWNRKETVIVVMVDNSKELRVNSKIQPINVNSTWRIEIDVWKCSMSLSFIFLFIKIKKRNASASIIINSQNLKIICRLRL
jgi:hypothetical protein